MSAWRDLPNAAYIDRIIDSLKTHPDIWTADSDAAQARRAGRVARDLLRNADWRAAWFASWQTVQNEAWQTARPSIVALIVWDDSARFLEMTSDELIVWIRLSNNPAAILMLPAVKAFEQIAACLDTGSESAYNHNHALI